MTGPTREEVEAVLQRGANLHDFQVFALDHDAMREGLTAAEPLMRARHVREAVEGLSGVDAPEDDIVRLRWVSEGGVHYSCTFPRAVLLAALTREGK